MVRGVILARIVVGGYMSLSRRSRMFALFLLLWLAICAGMVYAAFLVHPLVGVFVAWVCYQGFKALTGGGK